MNWEQAVKHIGWAFLIIQIGTITFGDVLLQGGLDKWAADHIQKMAGDLSGAWVWFIFVVLTGLASQIVTNLALAALVLPIMQVWRFPMDSIPSQPAFPSGSPAMSQQCFPSPRLPSPRP